MYKYIEGLGWGLEGEEIEETEWGTEKERRGDPRSRERGRVKGGGHR